MHPDRSSKKSVTQLLSSPVEFSLARGEPPMHCHPLAPRAQLPLPPATDALPPIRIRLRVSRSDGMLRPRPGAPPEATSQQLPTLTGIHRGVLMHNSHMPQSAKRPAVPHQHVESPGMKLARTVADARRAEEARHAANVASAWRTERMHGVGITYSTPFPWDTRLTSGVSLALGCGEHGHLLCTPPHQSIDTLRVCKTYPDPPAARQPTCL